MLEHCHKIPYGKNEFNLFKTISCSMKQSRKNLYVILICITLTLVTAAVYWQVQWYELINLDDDVYVGDNQQVLNGLKWEGIIWAFRTRLMGNWHPLTWLSFMADCHFFQNYTRACHTTNVILHIANTLLLFYILKRMTGCVFKSAFVAALFALHPLHVESVAWVSERKDVLSTLFWMLTMLAYVRYTERTTYKRYIVVVILFILGLMSKAMLVTLPFVFLLLDYWPLKRFNIPRISFKKAKDQLNENSNNTKLIGRLVVEKIPLFIITALSAWMSFVAQKTSAAVVNSPLLIQLCIAVISYGKYIVKMFWPTNLAVYYPYPSHIDKLWLICSFIFLLSITKIVIFVSRHHRYLLFGWLWYLGTMIPVIGIVQLGSQSMADRYTYIPLIGLFVMVVWGVDEITRDLRSKKILLASSGTITIIILSILTWFQVGYWKNSFILFEHTLAVTENNSLAHNNFALALTESGNLEEAIVHYQQAVKTHPNFKLAVSNLGMAQVQVGRFNEAVKTYRDYLKIDPDNPKIQKELADALLLRQKNRNPNAITSSLTLQDKEDLNEAIKHYKSAIDSYKDDAELQYNLAVALHIKGNLDEAINQYRKVLKINPNHVQALQSLNKCLNEQKRIKNR
jgi:tetratricopeptide (TPR) repeat protein